MWILSDSDQHKYVFCMEGVKKNADSELQWSTEVCVLHGRGQIKMRILSDSGPQKYVLCMGGVNQSADSKRQWSTKVCTLHGRGQ